MTDSRQPGSVPTNKDDAAERAAASAEVPAAAGERGLSASSARALREELFGEELLDELMAQVDAGGLQLTGQGGFLPELIKAVLERGLQAELSDHLGYEKGDPAGRGSPNSRNGSTPKTLGTEVGPVGLDTPRDRAGSFEPRLVPKGQRRLGGLDEVIISLYAGGMTIRDIQHHLARTLGTELSHETISNITDAVLDEVKAWQSRPLEELYPIVYLDALVVKVKENHQVRNKAAHIAVGVDTDGVKHVLGIWVQTAEGAKFWAGVCAELRNRGLRDILIACCDGLTGLPEAIEATWPHTVVQTCVVHLIRASMRFVSYDARKPLAAALRPIYTAPTVEAAEFALLELSESALGKRYPGAVATWTNAWERFIPFLEFPPEVRKIIYTTNAIESLNYQLRKIIKNRGHFPNDEAVIKLLWLAIRDIEDKRARARAKEKGVPKGQRKAEGRLIEGAVTQHWKQALNALLLAYPDRLAGHIN
jgi:putative transposase